MPHTALTPRLDTQGAYDAAFITQLVRNYRAHPALLALPSRLFYGSNLVACADPAITESVLRSDFKLPNQRWAVAWI